MVLEPGRVFAIHLKIVALLVIANVPIAIMDGRGRYHLFGYSRLMRLEEEANIPSTFSALALAGCAVAAQAIRVRLAADDRDRWAWALLAGFFAVLAFDEVAMIHELGNRFSYPLAPGAVLKSLGVYLYLPVLVWLAARLYPFWLRQERRLRTALCVGAVVYVAGAMGFELVESTLKARGMHNPDLPVRLALMFEEGAEMLGVAVFLHAFLRRFAALGGGPLIGLAVAEPRGASQPAAGERPAQKMPISSSP